MISCVAALTLVLALLWGGAGIVAQNASSQSVVSPCIILDAGHGSPDGGTTGVDGQVEKDINLAITLKTEKFLKLAGYNVILTRADDSGIFDNNLSTIRKKKISDMNKRLDVINKNPNNIFVSIHQNYYEGASSGSQIFYSPNNPNSKIFAQTIQDSIKELIQPENHRKIKQSDRSLFLLLHAKSPAVLIECGFLSDYKEAKLLASDEYQNKMAFCIYVSIVRYFSL